MEEKSYTVVVKGQVAHVYDEYGNILPSNEYDIIAGYIRWGKSERRAQEVEQRAKVLQVNGQWVFPERRPDIFSSGRCVYFLRAEAMPDLIKIGRTSNLASRTKALARECESAITVIAFVKTPYEVEAEEGFHALFSKARCQFEWFYADPVLSYLEQFRGG